MSYKFVPFINVELTRQQPLLWFAALWSLLLFVPLVHILPQINRPMLFWRVELAASVFLLLILICTFWSNSFQNLFPKIYRKEFLYLIFPCLAFIVWSGLSSFWAVSISSVFHHTLLWAIYLIFYFLVRSVVEDKYLFRFTFVPLIFIIWLIALPAVLEYFFIFNGNGTTLGLRYSRYAEMFNAILPVIFALALNAREKKKFWLLAITVLLMWLLIVSSMSRGSLLLLIVGCFLFAAWCIIFSKSTLIKRRTISFLIAFVIVVGLTQTLPSLVGKTTTLDRATDEHTKESTSVRPLFAAIAWEMFKDRPILGVGADNYGLEFNRFREIYAVNNPSDLNLATTEEAIAERTHNEYLQILSELGLPGAFFFLCFLTGTSFLFFKALLFRRQISVVTVGALIGLLLFLASSLVSSYSFRLMQNGIVFFFILAIAAKDLLPQKKQQVKTTFHFSPLLAKGFCIAGIITCFTLAIYSLTRAASLYFVQKAMSVESVEDSNLFLEKAKSLDSDNATAYYLIGSRFLLSERPREAIPHFQTAIAKGITSTAMYSYLASSQTLAGEASAAERTMADAVRIYPRSTFARMRYAALLERNGKTVEAENQKNIALQINQKHAATWWVLITEGAKVAGIKAIHDKNFAIPMDLKPQNAMFAVLEERGIINPEEKINITIGF